MGTFLIRSFVVLTVLSSSCASPEQLLTCDDLARIQRGTEEALKEIAQTQRQKKVDQCQTLDENQTQVKLAVSRLEGRLEQGLKDRLASDQMEQSRLDDIEAKVDTQVDELKAAQASSEERLQAIEDRLKAMQVETLQTLEQRITELGLLLNNSLESLGQRLGVIEERVATQANKTKQLEANHTSYKSELQPIKDTMKAMQEQLTGVALRRACQPPFELVGDDCVHLHDAVMSWANARLYCQDLGGDLLEPADKQRFVLEYRYHSLSEPHPPLFDFLERIRKSLSLTNIRAWVGGSVDGEGKATWTSGDQVPGHHSVDPLECIGVEAFHDQTYTTWALPCNNRRRPLCH